MESIFNSIGLCIGTIEKIDFGWCARPFKFGEENEFNESKEASFHKKSDAVKFVKTEWQIQSILSDAQRLYDDKNWRGLKGSERDLFQRLSESFEKIKGENILNHLKYSCPA